MSKHSYYEKLCALTALGEVPASESQVLDSHLRDCGECRDRVADYIRLHQDLTHSERASDDAQIAASRGRVEQMMWANIAMIDDDASIHLAPAVPRISGPAQFFRARRVWTLGLASAAAVACAFVFGVEYDRSLDTPAAVHLPIATGQSSSTPAAPHQSVPPVNVKLEAENRELSASLGQARKDKEEIEKTLAAQDQQLAQAIQTEATLRDQINQQTALVKSTQAELDTKSAALEQAISTKSADATTLAGLQFQIHDLTERLHTQNASLDRERDLLSHGREIRDIIGARNLHIIDVYDTDTGGATKKPFARAFYTEGKSLVYYAYDLPQKKADEGKFSYVAWGETNGSKASIKKIGLLFHDDQTQRRWSLNFDNPEVLSEIDSVFITLERTDEDLTQPKGKRLLTAYLGTPPNHP